MQQPQPDRMALEICLRLFSFQYTAFDVLSHGIFSGFVSDYFSLPGYDYMRGLAQWRFVSGTGHGVHGWRGTPAMSDTTCKLEAFDLVLFSVFVRLVCEG